MGFFIIAPDFTNIGSMQDANMGRRNLIAEHHPDLLRKAFSGQTVFIPPIFSDAPPTMFVATPVRDENGAVSAVMTLLYDPYEDLTQVCQAGRLGRTGETYGFDRDGLLISESRFEASLVKAGLLPEGDDATLVLRISDPGGNLLRGYRPSFSRDKQPLTHMAAESHSLVNPQASNTAISSYVNSSDGCPITLAK